MKRGSLFTYYNKSDIDSGLALRSSDHNDLILSFDKNVFLNAYYHTNQGVLLKMTSDELFMNWSRILNTSIAPRDLRLALDSSAYELPE